MRHRLLFGFSAALLLAISNVSAAFADTRLTYKVTEGAGGSIQAVLIGQGKLRTDAAASTSVIVDPATSAMIVIDHSKKTFMRIGRAEMDQIVAMMKQLEQAMAGMPPEVRDKMKAMMGGGEMISVVNTGRKETVAGRACTVSETKMQGQTIAESCDAPFSALKLPDADEATVLKASQMFAALTAQLAASPLAKVVSQVGIRTDVFPLRSTTIQGTQRTTSELVSVENAALPADLFTVPAGYKEQKMDMPKIGK
jgi:hypothetical protein